MDGQWLTPFDPLVNSAYSEGNAYQYLFVPHDIDGLKDLMGGAEEFSLWLDELFSLTGGENEDGTIGQYNHGNEPSHHLAYLYNFTGEAWKTQKLTHQILTQFYSDAPDGIAGNEDCGQMSAWYILSSMGFYSVTPGQDMYAIGTPLFGKISINLENGNRFVIEAKNRSPENMYIQSATLNGAPFLRSYIFHHEIMSGSKLVFVMGPLPNKDWGSDPSDRPWSENGDPVISLIKSSVPEHKKVVLNENGSADNIRQGLKYDYFERFFVTTDDFDKASPVESGITDNFNLHKAGRDSYFGFCFSGYVKVPEDGIYNFYLESNDGSRLFIDGEEIIENDANHGAIEEQGSVGLEAGLHEIEVRYFQCGGGKKLKVSWEGPGLSKREIDSIELFHKTFDPTAC